MRPWSPLDPLAPGPTLLEASAGTGKTHGITSLALRLVAELGIPIERLLIVTYTRAATAELKDRIRSRFATAAAVLAGRAHTDDPVLLHLREVPAAPGRLARALADFDRAVISTIHGFCQRMLQFDAFGSRVALDLELVTDTQSILDDLADDALVRALFDASAEEAAFLKEQCLFGRTELRGLARKALADPDLPISPDPEGPEPADPGDRAAWRRAGFARDVRRRFEAHAALRRVHTWQDLLRGLARRLGPAADDAERDALAGAIGSQFDAALIDEFQDTDALQWTLFSTCFGTGRHHLYLIGDPKQSIYGFRGANIRIYRAAAASAGERRYTLDTNWRSSPALLGALEGVLHHPGAFGVDVGFEFVPVRAAPREHPADPPGAPLEIRWIDPAAVGGETHRPLGKEAVATFLPGRVAADAAEILAAGGVSAGEMAVLVRTGAQANAVQRALGEIGIPAVLSGAQSVLASDEALAVQQWLEALLGSGGGSASRVAASNLLFGWTAADLLAIEAADPGVRPEPRGARPGPRAALDRWNQWLEQLASWRARFLADGFTPAFGAALDACGVLARLLSASDGERRATNLLHVAELLDAVEREERLGLATLLGWLQQRRAEEETDAEERELRLDLDRDAVSILTMHKAKGLEFRVVLVPWLWDAVADRPLDRHAIIGPHPTDPLGRVLDVHPYGRGAGAPVREAARREAAEEALRLAYVALTRAKSRCLVYAGWINGAGDSPLAAFLHGSGEDRISAARARFQLGPDALLSDLRQLAAAGRGIALTTAGRVPAAVPPVSAAGDPVSGGAPPHAELAARAFRRTAFESAWRRHSYTSLVRAAGPMVEEPGREGFDDDRRAGDPVRDPAAPRLDEVPLAAFPSGAEAGTVLHGILEHTDFEDRASLRAAVADGLAVSEIDGRRSAGMLEAGLAVALDTPLGGPLGSLALRHLPRGDRLDEMRFDLPLPAMTGAGLAEALRGSALPQRWLDSLDRLAPLRLAGFLTGSIDLLFRARGRWWVVDYKSNRLVRDGACTADAFSTDALAAELEKHDYYLQYHLYLVAVQRFLRWRLGPEYDYDRAIGGVYYLFLRGMTGAPGAGCWFDRPDRRVIDALDRALGAR